MGSSKSYVFILLAIVLLGGFLRLQDLDKENYWMDEIITISHAQEKTPLGVIEKVGLHEGAPFGHYLLLHYWTKAFGISEFSTRILSVIFGVLSIVMMFLLGNLLFGKKIGLVSSLLLATSMLQVLFSQETRLYAMYTFLSLLATYLFIKIYQNEKYFKIEKKHHHQYYCLYFLIVLIAIYTNYFTGFLMVGYALFWLWNWENDSKEGFLYWLKVNILILICSIPLIPLIQKQLLSIGKGAGETFASLGVPSIIAKFGLFMFALPLLSGMFLILLALLCKEKIKFFLRDHKLPQKWFLLIVILFSISYMYLSLYPLTIFGLPIFRIPIIHSYFLIRHSFLIAPLFYLFFSYHLIRIPSRKIAMAAISILLFTNAFALTAYYTETTKPEWDPATSFIKQNSDTDPLVLLDRGGLTSSSLLTYYYEPGLRYVQLTKWPRGQPLWKIEQERFFSITDQESYFWLVLSRNQWTEDYYKVLLRSRYALVEQQEFKDIKIYKFKTE